MDINIDSINLDNVKNAFAIANNAIYFNDRSDYQTALYEVCMALNPTMDVNLIGSKYIKEEKVDKIIKN